MARTQKAAEETEVPQETAQETAQEAVRRTRKPVALVLSGAHQISAEVAADDDMAPARKTRSSALDDELQQVFEQHVALSWERQRMITLQVPAEAERETVKRLRHAAAKAGLGLALGNVRPDPSNPANVVRVPFQARVRKQYKPRQGKTEAE